MSLIKCPECEKEISNKSKICINCGFPIEEMYKFEAKKDVNKCIYCNSQSFDIQGYCNECGMKKDVFTNEYEEIEEDNLLHTICPVCSKSNKKDVYICAHCGHKYTVKEYILRVNNENFNGIYRHNKGRFEEVYCPRCMSDNCSHYQEQKIIPAKIKTSYSANLNPFRPFTFANKTEKVIRKERSYTESKFICNSCGFIFY